MKKRMAVGIAGTALAIGVGTSAGVTGYMIGHHTAAPAATWRIEPSDIERAVGEYLRQQQWEATKRQVMQPDISSSDDLLTPRRPIARNAAGDGSDWCREGHLHRDLTKQQTYTGGR
ncbi:hypothetical protein [Mycolicibacter arupensis]|uniref:Uncharacterized protein n=1 Tax=Mycolicibacter arupensis TaxID=342002 RepID=A0A5C7Y2X8_9MYCO|nr:hypothetical protein [Mycolicibacter arupensis]TXI55932.1 MAG: hypothetical protein E6Q54_11945 [Mycolicibacter arupensis]